MAIRAFILAICAALSACNDTKNTYSLPPPGAHLLMSKKFSSLYAGGLAFDGERLAVRADHKLYEIEVTSGHEHVLSQSGDNTPVLALGPKEGAYVYSAQSNSIDSVSRSGKIERIMALDSKPIDWFPVGTHYFVLLESGTLLVGQGKDVKRYDLGGSTIGNDEAIWNMDGNIGVYRKNPLGFAVHVFSRAGTELVTCQIPKGPAGKRPLATIDPKAKVAYINLRGERDFTMASVDCNTGKANWSVDLYKEASRRPLEQKNIYTTTATRGPISCGSVVCANVNVLTEAFGVPSSSGVACFEKATGKGTQSNVSQDFEISSGVGLGLLSPAVCVDEQVVFWSRRKPYISRWAVGATYNDPLALVAENEDIGNIFNRAPASSGLTLMDQSVPEVVWDGRIAFLAGNRIMVIGK